MNKIHLIGRLTKDPELSFGSGNGTAITKFTIAVNRPRLDKNKPQEADFINCVAFGKRAEAIANYVQKGHLFGISGRLQINKYVDKEGNNRWSADILVEDFEFLQQKKANENQSNTQSSNSNGFFPVDDDDDIPF